VFWGDGSVRCPCSAARDATKVSVLSTKHIPAVRGGGPRITIFLYSRVLRRANSHLEGDNRVCIIPLRERETGAVEKTHGKVPSRFSRVSAADHHQQREDVVGPQSRRPWLQRRLLRNSGRLHTTTVGSQPHKLTIPVGK